ncbi:hypothetical protein CSBG_03459 [Clostridium sp. 7_2_43FAA]|jgi:hypothetical protein|nr:hypothetical protein CSBG_03459 [Clostridium sp. 7_2_43FAA]MBP1867807.1 hypothetical protein [Clostridium tertium]
MFLLIKIFKKFEKSLFVDRYTCFIYEILSVREI